MAVSVVVAGAVLVVALTRDSGGASNHTAACRSTATGAGPLDRATARVGHGAPDFELPSVDCKVVRLSQFRGRPVVLTFFASWCHPCEEELPVLERVAREHGGRVAVVAVNYQDFADDSRRFAARLKISYPALLEDSTKNPVAARYGVHGIPMTFFIAADGTIAHTQLFGETNRAALQPGLDAISR